MRNPKELSEFEFAKYSLNWFRAEPKIKTLLSLAKSPKFFILALISSLIAFSTYPTFGVFIQSNRWFLAAFAGAFGGLVYLKGIRSLSPELKKYCNYSFILILWCFTCTFIAGSPEDSQMRSIAFAILMSFGVLGISAWCSKLSGILGCFICLSLFVFIMLGTVVMPSFEQTYNFDDQNWRYQGSSTLKATGSATSINLALPLLVLLFKYKVALRPFIGVLFIFLCITLIATKTRTGIITLLCVIPATYSFIKGEAINRVFVYCMAVILTGGTLLVMSEALQENLRFKRDDEYNITGGRAERWGNIYKKSLANPITGHAIGQSNYHHISLEDRKRGIVTAMVEQKSVAHNQHLSVFYELGLPGLIVFWLMTGQTIIAGFKSWKRRIKNPFGVFYRDILCSTFIIWGVLFVDTFSHNGLFTVGNLKTFIYWMIASLIICGNEYGKYLYRVSSPTRPKRKES